MVSVTTRHNTKDGVLPSSHYNNRLKKGKYYLNFGVWSLNQTKNQLPGL